MFMVTKSFWSFHHSTLNRCLQVSKCLFKPSTSLSPKTLAFFSQDFPSSSKFNSKTFYLIPTFFSVQFFAAKRQQAAQNGAKTFLRHDHFPLGIFEPREKPILKPFRLQLILLDLEGMVSNDLVHFIPSCSFSLRCT